MRKILFLLGSLIAAAILPILAFAPQRSSPPAASPAAVTGRAVAAANAFLKTLDDAQRPKALFAFDSPQKTNWSNLPTGIYQRNSLRLGDLTAAQHAAALALMKTVLSSEGYQKITDIMNGDEMLKNAGGGRTGGRPGGGGRGGGIQFGVAEYYIAILGTPSPSTPWMIQFGGHHLAINVTIARGANVMTPSLPATQPAVYTLNGQSIRPLGDEHDKGFALINALDAAQQKQAILNFRISDLVLGPGQDGRTIAAEGIPVSALTAAQQSMLLDLVHEWVGILNDEGAAAKMAEIRASLPRMYFAWSGPTAPGSVAYFRVQGPTVVIEYAPQQGDLDHIHTIYRDPTNDYGAKLVTP
jgi:Protein of unknown function (DUF3500)